jgi:predicted ATPase
MEDRCCCSTLLYVTNFYRRPLIEMLGSRQALDAARRQSALSWELRAATSLARLWHDQNKRTEALALLQPVYDRFTEGFGTADLKAAKALLNTLV